jgi:signal transduction histidine kinase
MSSSERRLTTIAAVAAVAAAGSAAAAWLQLNSDHLDTPTHGFLDLLIVWAFVGGGLVAIARRPDNRVGLLLVATGLGWLGHLAYASDTGWVAALSIPAYGIFLASITTLFVVYPAGVVGTARERLLVACCLVVGLLLYPAQLLFLASPVDDCDACPSNPLAVTHEGTFASIAQHLPGYAAAALTVVLVVRLLLSYRDAPPTRRPSLSPVVIAASGTTALFVLAVLVNSFAPGISTVTDLAAEIALATIPLAFATGLLREKLFRSDVLSDLVAGLAGAVQPAEVELALAAALRDPDLRLAFWLPESERFIDVLGTPIEASLDDGVCVHRDGQPLAVILHGELLVGDQALVDAVASAAGLALERARLDAELAARITDLAASRARIAAAGDAARRRIERDLHDGAQQRLVSVALQLRVARAAANGDPEVGGAIDRAADELSEALAELRELARGIHPAVLTQRGLRPALEVLAARTPVHAEVQADDSRFASEIESALFFVASEALANVAKHAQATRVAIRLEEQEGCLALAIVDDGVGGAAVDAGSGLAGLGDRVEAVGGRLRVRSVAGVGTTIEVTVPAIAAQPA